MSTCDGSCNGTEFGDCSLEHEVRTRGVVSGPLDATAEWKARAEKAEKDTNAWIVAFTGACERISELQKRAFAAEAKVTELAAHIRRLEEEPSAEAFAKWLDAFSPNEVVAQRFARVIRRGVWFKKPEGSGAV